MIQLLKNTCLKEIIGITSKIIFLFFPDAFVHILYIQMCPLRRARRLWEGILKKRRWTPISPSQSKIQKESTVLKNCAMTLIKNLSKFFFHLYIAYILCLQLRVHLKYQIFQPMSRSFISSCIDGSNHWAGCVFSNPGPGFSHLNIGAKPTQKKFNLICLPPLNINQIVVIVINWF